MKNINFFTATGFLSKLLDIWTVRSDEKSGERFKLLWVDIPSLNFKDPNAPSLPGTKTLLRETVNTCRQLDKGFLSRFQGKGGEAASSGVRGKGGCTP